jgi:hypothetical protein
VRATSQASGAATTQAPSADTTAICSVSSSGRRIVTSVNSRTKLAPVTCPAWSVTA